MKAAIVDHLGQSPVYDDFAEPVTTQGESLVSVTAAAISQVTRSRAAGSHYSNQQPPPFGVGIDGVGHLADGSRVYFVMPRAPFGSMAERTVVATAQSIALPDGLDDITAAAIANPGMSSWAAYVERARLQRGETVLVNGATGLSGKLAVQIARHLGAGKVIATGRNAKTLATLGADVTIALTDDAAALEDQLKAEFAQGIDVVIDYLWGQSALTILVAGARAGAEAVPIRFVQIGSVSGSDITLPSAVLRASAITLMGGGIGSIRFDRMLASIDGLFKAVVPAGLSIATHVMPLTAVQQAWSDPDTSRRIVLTIPS
ncbi:MAG: quinone oxidoreductase family protein [Devosia sp.]